MAKYTAPPSGQEQRVTASDLVRHFGIWQDRATRAPVYILHRGRPRLVMTSLDVMDALCAPHTSQPDMGSHVEAVLDVLEDMIVVLGQDQNIIAASRGARRYFGEHVQSGLPVTGLAATGDSGLAATIGRVTTSGLSETMECRSPRFSDRLLSFTVDSYPGGCILQVGDASAAEDMQLWRDRHVAMAKALEAAGIASAIVNLRGRIEEASDALVALTGASREAMATARIVSLVTVSDRSALGDAFEAAIDQRAPQSLKASVLVGGAMLRQVSIGLSPLAISGHVVGVTAVFAPFSE